MSVKFVKNSQTLDSGMCLKGLNILGHAQIIELDLGSTCGGHGKCGKDRVRLTSDVRALVNPPTEIENHQLTQAELDSGLRLACQCFPNRDDLELSVFPMKT